MTQLIYLESRNNILCAAAIYYKLPIGTFRSKYFVRIPMLKSRGKLNLRLLRVVRTKVFGAKKNTMETCFLVFCFFTRCPEVLHK